MRFLVAILLFIMPFSLFAKGLVLDTIPVLKSGDIIGNIPYGKPFYLSIDPTDKYENFIELIQVRIYTNSRKNCEKGEFSKDVFSTFLRPKVDPNTNKFYILVNTRLRFSTCYRVIIDYYKDAKLSSDNFGDILEETITKYTSDQGAPFSGAIGSLTEELVNSTKAAIIDEVNSKGNFDLVEMGEKNLKKVKFSELPEWVLNANDPKGMVFNLASIIVSEEALILEKSNLDNSIAELTKLREDSLQAFPLLKTKLEEIASNSNNKIISEIEIDNIETFFMTGKRADGLFLKYKDVRDLLSGGVRSFYRQLYRKHKSLTNNHKNVDDFEKDIVQYQKNIEMAKSSISAYVLVQQSFSNTLASFTTMEKLEKIKFSTPIGFGATLINPGKDISEYNGLAYLGVRYYFFAVDKGLISNPYLNRHRPFNRMSFSLGFLLGSGYEYRGADLKNAFIVKPVFSLGYDIDRFITIDAGVIAFKIDSNHPFNNDPEWKFAPHIGLSLELDVFNRINSSFKNGPDYKIE